MKRIVFFLLTVTIFVTVSCKSTKVAPSQVSEMQQLQEQLTAKDAEIKSLQQQLEAAKTKLAIYDFFNDEEISIFANKTLEQNSLDKTLAGKTKITYETIRMIADVEQKLTDIDNKILQLQKQQKAKKWSENELRNAIKLDIKADMDPIGESLDAIDERDLSVLSNKQLDYYKKQCQRFKDISRKYL